MKKINKYYYAIGDVHGYLQLLKESLKVVDLNNKENKLIFLGDYIDKGNESSQVLYYIKELVEQYPNQVIALKGNHEEMFLEWLANPIECIHYFLEEKELCTPRTFLTSEETEEFLEKMRIANDFFEISKQVAEKIKNKHKEMISWLKNLPYYYETENQIFVHSGIEEEAEDLWKWGTPKEYFANKFPPTTGYFEKDIIAGHVGVNYFDKDLDEIYWDEESHFFIDTIDGNDNEKLIISVLKYNQNKKEYTGFKKENNIWIEYKIK